MSTQKLRRRALPLYPRTTNAPTFSIVQWNILADGLAQNGDFIKVDPGCLEWDYRLPLLLSELQEANADIVCMQELNHFGRYHPFYDGDGDVDMITIADIDKIFCERSTDDLKQHLEPLGYQAAGFLPKHCSPAARYKCAPDGLAIFYKASSFRVASPAKGADAHGTWHVYLACCMLHGQFMCRAPCCSHGPVKPFRKSTSASSICPCACVQVSTS